MKKIGNNIYIKIEDYKVLKGEWIRDRIIWFMLGLIITNLVYILIK